jgi:hypothetical protein
MKQKIKIDGKTEYVIYPDDHGAELMTANNDNWAESHRDKKVASIREECGHYHVKVRAVNFRLDISEVGELYYLLKARHKALGLPKCKVK